MRYRLLRLVAALLATALCVLLTSGRATADPRSGAPSGLPSDPNVKGYVGLCDQSGHNVVSGDVRTKPFVWKAVASTPPPKAYQGVGQNAVLNVYQPRPDTRPSEWSGTALTAASFYSNPRHPAVQSTYLDLSLADFIRKAPAKVNGLYVLRIFWGKRDYGLYNASYPSTTIQVRGSRWYVVSGGTVDCTSTTRGVSLEQLTGVASKKDVTPRAPVAGQSTAPAGRPRAITSAPAIRGARASTAGTGGTSAGLSDAAAAGASRPTSSGATSSGLGWLPWTLGAVVVVLGLLLFLVTRRRPRPASPTGSLEPDPKG